MSDEVRVVTWNVLAAPWAAPAFYPDGMDPALLDRRTRTELVAKTVRSIDADVLCLQETTPIDLATVLLELDGRYDHHAVPNGPELWANWSTPVVPWEPNGTAVLWRRGRFDAVARGGVELSSDGNVATWVELTGPGGAQFRIMSVHLDADDLTIRRAQLPVALAAFAAEPGTVDVVAGDCNEDAGAGDLGAKLDHAGFVDALSVLGITNPTHPYARPGDGWEALARLDHVMLRGVTPAAGAVLDFGTWTTEIPGDRMAALLAATGSDHNPVAVTLVPFPASSARIAPPGVRSARRNRLGSGGVARLESSARRGVEQSGSSSGS